MVGQSSVITEEIPASIEIGLLAFIRKILIMLPDNQVRGVVGNALQHETLIAIAQNKNIVVRTTVVCVLNEYFKRGGDGVRSNFVQVKGFYLLGSQLKKYKVNFALINALCSIVMNRQIDLEKEQ